MAALNVNDVFKFVQFVANKEHRGWISPDEFNIAAEVAQLTLYSELEGQYAATKKKHAYLRPFEESMTVEDADGIPAGFRIAISGYDDSNNEANEIELSELPGILGSSIVAPEEGYPVFYLFDDEIKILPNTTELTIFYLRAPNTTPTWGYTTPSGRPVYAVGSSTQFEFDETAFLDISLRILNHVGLNIGKEEITQYASAKLQG